jgi:Domain of unknown function (DUF932)
MQSNETKRGHMLTDGLSNDEIQRYAPSVFAGQASARQSERYAFIPTINVVEAMRAANWSVVKASQSSTRDEARKGFTKHMLRFRANDTRLTAVGDSLLEVVLINSHDGSSQYSLQAGVFRLVCSNGMVIADSLIDAIKVRHTGNVIDMVIDGSARILENTPKVQDVISTWKQITLSTPEQRLLAESAHSLRFDEGSAIRPEQLLNPRRRDDAGSDLWSTFNRIQEHTIKGGDRAYDRNADNGRGRRVRSREVKNISGNVSLNKALWSLAEKMAELKAA